MLKYFGRMKLALFGVDYISSHIQLQDLVDET